MKKLLLVILSAMFVSSAFTGEFDGKGVISGWKFAPVQVGVGFFESANLLSALALRNKGQIEEANQMVNSWKQNYPSDKAVQWCIAIYNGNKEDATELLRTKNSKDDETPWEMTFRDRNSDLILRLFE